MNQKQLDALNRQVAMTRICDFYACKHLASNTSLDYATDNFPQYYCDEHAYYGRMLRIGAEVRHHIHGHIGRITHEIGGYWGVYWYGGLAGWEQGELVRLHGLPPFWNRKGIQIN